MKQHPLENFKGGRRMNRILISSLLLAANLSAEPSKENEENFNCVESLSTTQFLTGIGVGALATVGGFIAGGLVAEELFPSSLSAFIFIPGLTGTIAGSIGIFGTWKFFCEGNKKNYMTFKISPNTVASQWVFNF
jgi:hypothetical protein